MSTPPNLRPVDAVAVTLTQDPWSFSHQHAADISSHWRRKRTTHPHYFNGTVHVLRSWTVQEVGGRSIFSGDMMRTDFASFLYWKEQARQRSEFDFSGGGAVVCTDGALLLVVSGEHTIAPGTLEFPSGLVDRGDFLEDGQLNFRRHVEREVCEELALTPGEIGRPVRHLATLDRETVQVVSIFRAGFDGGSFVRRWRENAAAAQKEIGDVVALHDARDMREFEVPPHVEAAASHILAQIGLGAYAAPRRDRR